MILTFLLGVINYQRDDLYNNIAPNMTAWPGLWENIRLTILYDTILNHDNCMWLPSGNKQKLYLVLCRFETGSTAVQTNFAYHSFELP